MAEEIKVNPTPIQRNLNDVAMELTQLYFSKQYPENMEEIQNAYTDFYATAKMASVMSSDKAKEHLDN